MTRSYSGHMVYQLFGYDFKQLSHISADAFTLFLVCGPSAQVGGRQRGGQPHSRAQWEVQIANWRLELAVSEKFMPWDYLKLQATGVKMTPRVKALLNTVVADRVKTVRVKGKKAFMNCVKNTVVDLSQNPIRKAFSKLPYDTMPALTTSSLPLHIGRDALILPSEMLCLQGHNPESFRVPEGMSPAQLRRLAGEGMPLPCLGLIVMAILLTKGFPSP